MNNVLHTVGALLSDKRAHDCIPAVSVCAPDSLRHFNFFSTALLLGPSTPTHPHLKHSSSSSADASRQLILSFSFLFCMAPRHMGPAGLQDGAQELDCANGRNSCAEVRGAPALGDGAVGERRPPPGTREESAWLSTLQHDHKPPER